MALPLTSVLNLVYKQYWRSKVSAYMQNMAKLQVSQKWIYLFCLEQPYPVNGYAKGYSDLFPQGLFIFALSQRFALLRFHFFE